MRPRLARVAVAFAVIAAVGSPPALGGGRSAADAQYAPVSPITKPKPAARHTQSPPPPPPTIQTQGQTSGKPGKGGLPFTGLSLVVPVVVSGALIAGGFALRRKSADRPPRQ